MRKIDLSSYTTNAGPFDVCGSLVAVLFMESQLPPREVLERDRIANRVETATDSILLEEAEYSKVLAGLNATDLKPFGRDVVEFVRRVLEAPVVEVQAK